MGDIGLILRGRSRTPDHSQYNILDEFEKSFEGGKSGDLDYW